LSKTGHETASASSNNRHVLFVGISMRQKLKEDIKKDGS